MTDEPQPAYDALTLERAHGVDFEWEPEWKGRFLESLRLMPNVAAAARFAGVARQHAYWTRRHDPLFGIVWDDALEVAVDGIERFAHTMATTGLETNETRRTVKRELVTTVGENGVASSQLVTTEETTVEVTGRLVSPQMTMFLLAAHRREKYSRSARVEHAAPDGGPVRVEVFQRADPVRALELARIAVELEGADIIELEATEDDDGGE